MSAPGSSEPVLHAGPEWATSCLNCGTRLGGVYCPSCGQQASDPNPTMRDLGAEFVGELTSFDGKLWRTLRTLFLHPGELTVAFFAGRRVSYISPVKLYLTCSLLGFLSGPLVDTVRERLGLAPVVTTVKGKRGGNGSGVHISAPDSTALDSLLKDPDRVIGKAGVARGEERNRFRQGSPLCRSVQGESSATPLRPPSRLRHAAGRAQSWPGGIAFLDTSTWPFTSTPRSSSRSPSRSCSVSSPSLGGGCRWCAWPIWPGTPRR